MQKAKKVTMTEIKQVCNGKTLGIKVRYALGSYNAYKNVKGHFVFIGSTYTQKEMTAFITDYINSARKQLQAYCTIYNAI